MNNLLALFRAELINDLALNRLIHPGNGRLSRRPPRVLLAIIPVLAVPAFSLSAIYMAGLARLLKMAGAFEYYTAFALILPWLCIFIVNLYMIPGTLFAFDDFDMLMALPVRPWMILCSKLLFLYVMDTAVAILLSCPIFVIDGINGHAGPTYYIFAVLALPVLPLVPMICGMLAAYAIGFLSVRFRSAQYVLIAVTMLVLLLVCLIPFLFAGVPGDSSEQMESIARMTGRMCTVLFPSILLMKALQLSDMPVFLSFILINVLPFLLFVHVLSKHFLKIHAQLRETGRPSGNHGISLKSSRVPTALFVKEIRRYFGTYVYVINTSFGMILSFFVTIMSVVHIPVMERFFVMLAAGDDLFPALMAVLAFSVCMSCTTSCSVSLDGRTLWLDRSLPISVNNIFRSKIALNLAVIVPLLLIDTVVLSIKFSLTSFEALLLFTVPLLYAILIACAGLLINLRFPRLVWKSPEIPVKQALSVLLAAALGFALVLVPVSMYLLMKPHILFFALMLVIFLLIANLTVWTMLGTAGARLYDHLE